MRAPQKVTLLALAFIHMACSDIAKTSNSNFIIRGKAQTGAHTRKAVSGGYVGILLPGQAGWTSARFSKTSGIPNKAVTQTDGSYTMKIDMGLLTTTEGYPAFVAVSDSTQTFTLLAEIPKDLAIEGAQLQLDINPSTTATSLLVCPGGKYPPGNGAYCYSDPNKTSSYDGLFVSTLESALATALTSLETTTPPNWATFLTKILADSATFDALKAVATTAGISSTAFTASAIPSAVSGATIPKVSVPTLGVDDNDPTPADSSSSGGCTATWSCGSSSQCAKVMGASNGTVSGFSTSSSCEAWCTQYIPGNCSCGGC